MVELTTKELNLLLYLEHCLVDQCGRLEAIRMNQDDWDVVEKMKDHITIIRGMSPKVGGKHYTHRITKYDNVAWEMTHAERKARAKRMVEEYWGEELDG